MKATDLRNGQAVIIDGKVSVLTQVEHRTPGNLRAFIQIKYKELLTGKSLERRLASNDDIQAVDVDKREMEYLFSDATGATFMDLESYDQMVLSEDLLGDALMYLKPNTSCTVLVLEGNPISIEMPGTVDLVVTETPPGIKGATATNQLKEATLETGLKTRVPPFITTGELVKISTADGSYLSRAKAD
jgi:elongation factor P